jgi:RecA-family ATPase
MTDRGTDPVGVDALFQAMDEVDAERYQSDQKRSDTIGAYLDKMENIDRENKKLFNSLGVKTSKDFFKERPPPIRWLVEGVMESKNLVMLAGAPKTAKSWFAIELGLAVATGGALFGDPLMTGTGESGSVLFFFLEDGPHNIYARVCSLAKTRGVRNPADLDLFFRFGGGLNMMNRSEALQLAEAIKCGIPKLDLIVFDPFRNLHHGDENDSADIIQVMENLRHIRDVTGAAVLVIHHTRKPSANDKANPGMALRGSGAIFGAVDGLIAMSSILDIGADAADTITNNVFVRVKAGREQRPFSVSLSIKDGFDGRAETVKWIVGAMV